MTASKGMSEDAPWYRHRWPWILIAGPAAVILASIVTVWIATERNDPLVAGDYYKQGLAINEDLARSKMASSLGLSGTLRSEPESWLLTLRAREGVSLPARLTVSLSHSTRQDLDQVLELSQQSPGYYHGVRHDLAPGRWQILLEDADRTWRLAASVRWPDFEPVVFLAKGTRSAD